MNSFLTIPAGVSALAIAQDLQMKLPALTAGMNLTRPDRQSNRLHLTSLKVKQLRPPGQELSRIN
jgi:hypothetical protein